MSSPAHWTEQAADIIARDGDMEEPPAFVSGHDSFLQVEAAYEGYSDPELADE